ncbi:C-type lectin domain family 10 member A-like [Xenentodon cancila]
MDGPEGNGPGHLGNHGNGCMCSSVSEALKQLSVLDTISKTDYVIARSHCTFYWMGLTDEKTGQWEWVNQTPYTMNRRRWKPGQPDSWTNHGLGPGDEDCAHMHYDGRLNDLHCSTRMRFICQRHSQHS